MTNFLSNPIEDVKNAVDIENVIQFYTGDEFKHGFMKCPFHNERTASFSINKAKQIYKCFGCGNYSDAVGFVAQFLHVNNRQAAVQIDKDFNLGIFENENNKEISNSIKITRKLQKEKNLIDDLLDEYFAVLSNFVCDYRHKDRDFQTDVDFQMADWLLDYLIYGTIEEKVEVAKKYARFIQRIREYRCN